MLLVRAVPLYAEYILVYRLVSHLGRFSNSSAIFRTTQFRNQEFVLQLSLFQKPPTISITLIRFCINHPTIRQS